MPSVESRIAMHASLIKLSAQVAAVNRRSLLLGASAVVAVEIVRPSFAEAADPKTYDEAVKLVRRPLDPSGGVREIVRAGTLGANSHNTQPWRFIVSEKQITIRPDFSRRCPSVDPDDHHLFASLGCAAENMVQAAPALGFRAEQKFEASNSDRITITLDRSQPARNGPAAAIVKRQCTRAEYDGRAVSAENLDRIRAAGTADGVECMIVTEPQRMDAILDYVVEGNTAQMRDPAFMAELISWIRFNDRMAVERLDGLSSRSSGNPSPPAWLARPLLRLVMTEKSENDKYAKQIRSSAGIAVFAAATDDKAGWIAAGRAYQRFALQATALDIRQAFLNQPTEVASLRPQIAASWNRKSPAKLDCAVRARADAAAVAAPTCRGGHRSDMKRVGLFLMISAVAVAVGFVLASIAYNGEIDRARRAAGSGGRIVTTAAGSIEYAEKGVGTPLLSIHGAGGGYDQGLSNAAELVGDGFRVIAPSRFGYLGTPIPGDASPAAQADAHAALLAELTVDKAIVVGISAGTRSAIELALRHPKTVAALVLMVPATYSPASPVAIDHSRGSRLAFWLVNAGADFAWWATEKIAPSVLIRFIGVPPDIVAVASEEDRHRVMQIVRSVQPLSRRYQGINIDSNPTLDRVPLEQINAPTLIISARDDLFNTLPAAKFAAATIPDAQLVVYDKGGHLLVGHDREVRALVGEFLAKANVKPTQP